LGGPPIWKSAIQQAWKPALRSFSVSCMASGVLLTLLGSGCQTDLPSASANAPKPGPGVFFVAAKGNDAWSGTKAVVGPGDGPFASVGRALQAARDYRRSAGWSAGSPVIWVRDGTYFLSESLLLTQEDSKFTLAAYPRETPVLSGGRRISGWREAELNGRKVWSAEVAEAREGQWTFRELWVNGSRAVRARHPDRGYLKVGGVPDAKDDQPWHQGQSRFSVGAEDFRTVQHPEDAEVLVMTRWVESRLPLVKVEPQERMLLFSKRSIYKLDPGDLWYAEGAAEFLDAPGEWCLDRREGRLYYAPRPGEQLATVQAVAPVLECLLKLDGQPEAGRFIENVTFRGLTFAHAEWRLPSDAKTAQAAAMVWPAPVNEIGGFGQAAVGVPGAVRGEGVRSSRFEDCRIVHLGSYGLELGRGCQSNVISRCELSDLGGGGIKIGETAIRPAANDLTQGNEISDCRIFDGGRMYHSAIGVWIGQSPNNRLAHNLIHDFYYTGISIGWTWGYAPEALATNNLVEWNHIHHIGVRSDGDGPILSDMGGIYTLGMQPGTRVLNNLWHDMAGFRYGGWGIYFDEGSSSIVAENNLVYRTTHGGFHQHYGATNVVRNNIFAFARDHQLQRSREEGHVSFIFTNNIVLFNQGVLLGSAWKNDRFVLDRNVYWDTRPDAKREAMKFAGAPLDQWRGRGHDLQSVIADPLFIAPERDDFRLRPESPALATGFRPIDLSGVGPRLPLVQR
jgi:hypothetical protein